LPLSTLETDLYDPPLVTGPAAVGELAAFINPLLTLGLFGAAAVRPSCRLSTAAHGLPLSPLTWV
jgi:hypothetical protein